MKLSSGFERLTGRVWVLPEAEPLPPAIWDYFLAATFVGLVGAAGGAFDALFVALGVLP